MIIEIPWDVGDSCWAVRSTMVHKTTICKSCDISSRKTYHTLEVQLATVTGVNVCNRGTTQTMYFTIAFDEGQYGTTAFPIWRSKQEAEDAFQLEYKHSSPYTLNSNLSEDE